MNDAPRRVEHTTVRAGRLGETRADFLSEAFEESANVYDGIDCQLARQTLKNRLFGGDSGELYADRYQLIARIGRGGMGSVWLAVDRELSRKVAIKVLDQPGEESSSREHQRLRREAQSLAQLSHPNVVTIYDVGRCQGETFIAMEFIDGRTLGTWIEEENPSLSAIIGAYLQAGRGLAAAHAVGFVHRDFKPQNVLVGNDGRFRVVDFGLARIAAGTHTPSQAGARITFDTKASASSSPAEGMLELDTVTATGAVLGTPAYMAPEQHLGTHFDASCDQYSFCVALFESLSGYRPFSAGDTRAYLAAKLVGPAVDHTSTPNVPARLLEVLAKGMSPLPDARFPSIEALLTAVAQAVEERRWPPRRIIRWAGASAVLAVVAIAMSTIGASDDVMLSRSSAGEGSDVADEARDSMRDAKVSDAPRSENAVATRDSLGAPAAGRPGADQPSHALPSSASAPSSAGAQPTAPTEHSQPSSSPPARSKRRNKRRDGRHKSSTANSQQSPSSKKDLDGFFPY